MAKGVGKYDDLCTIVREKADADAVIVFVLNGKFGTGFSVQTTSEELIEKLPELLEYTAAQIRVDVDAEKQVH